MCSRLRSKKHTTVTCCTCVETAVKLLLIHPYVTYPKWETFTKNDGKSPFLMGKLTINGHIYIETVHNYGTSPCFMGSHPFFLIRAMASIAIYVNVDQAGSHDIS